MDDIQPVKRKRGRPKGSKNRVGVTVPPNVLTPREVPPGLTPMADYRHADPLALVERHYAMVDWQQQALRQEMMIGLGAEAGVRSNADDIEKLMDLGGALMKALDSHKRAIALAEELAKNKTPEQLLEIAIRKVEGQDLPTLEAIIKRLRKKRTELAPVTKRESKRMGDESAVDAMLELEAE